MPQPKRRDLPWANLDASLQRVLRWLNACTLLRRDDLISIAWTSPISRQWMSTALQGWTDDHFIVPIDDGTAYGLGDTGTGKLIEAGIVTPRVQVSPAPRVRAGLLLASQFAAGLARDLLPEAGVTHLTWASMPFSGAGPRPDSYGAVRYSIERESLRDVGSLDLLHLATPDAPPLLGQRSMDLILEVDLGTESAEQLAQRARRWGMALRDQRAQVAPGCWPYVLWVTDGGWDRANTIWRAWIAQAACPLFITTVSMLTIDGALHPWYALWRDEHGKPRTLNPYGGQEAVWRFQASPPPEHATLEQAIRAWEATQRA
jgi:hypothetical protein